MMDSAAPCYYQTFVLFPHHPVFTHAKSLTIIEGSHCLIHWTFVSLRMFSPRLRKVRTNGQCRTASPFTLLRGPSWWLPGEPIRAWELFQFENTLEGNFNFAKFSPESYKKKTFLQKSLQHKTLIYSNKTGLKTGS